jgi:hypothetical protein
MIRMAGFTSAAAAATDKKTSASDTLLGESTGEQSTMNSSYTEKKVIGMPANRVRTTVRVTFTLKGQDAGTAAYGRIYYNGVAVGTEQSVLSTSYATKTEDIEIDHNGGTIELYLKGAGPGKTAYSDNLSIKGDETEIDQDYEVIT